MPLAMADPQVDKLLTFLKALKPGLCLAFVQSKYTEQAQPLSMNTPIMKEL
jgi:hypothetical protein